MFTESLDLFENRIGRGCPGERARLGVVGSDEVFDFGHEFFDAAERTAADGLLPKDVEPDFDLVEPGGVGRGEVHLIPRVHGQPALNTGVLVRGVVGARRIEWAPGHRSLAGSAGTPGGDGGAGTG